MGRGSRHSKNAGTMCSEAMTYAELRSLGYGRSYERLSKESIGEFDDCQLTLRTAVDPVCTPLGIIYSREAILKHLIWQTKNSKKNMDIYRKTMANDLSHDIKKSDQQVQMELSNLKRINQHGIHNVNCQNLYNKSQNALRDAQIHVSGGINIEINRMRTKEVKVFWGPNYSSRKITNQPMKKDCPDCINKCPITGRKLKYDDLTRLQFTKTRDSTNEYVDPITREVFTNGSNLICLRTTGDVFLLDVFKKFVEPTGIYNGHLFDNTDLIEIQKGGTGYTAHDGLSILASKNTNLGIGSGMTDLRGQHSGTGAKSGLVLL